MNKQESDILNELLERPFINQRILAQNSGHSLGIVNRSVKSLIEKGYISDSMSLTQKAKEEFAKNKPQNAIILAAGLGMRMVPINMHTSKGLLEVGGENLVERIIHQLHEVDIQEIYIVVGYMKEQYEYLIDEYGVHLIVNPEYASKNNLYSMKLVQDKLSNSYIIPCDIWCDTNPFNRYELYSWYMVSELVDDNSDVRVNRKMELVLTGARGAGNAMIGIAYLTEEQAKIVRDKVLYFSGNKEYDNEFWEKALYEQGKMIVKARVVNSSDVVEINTFEQLCELDKNSNNLEVEAIEAIMKVFNVSIEEIQNIRVLKKGMTNRSFFFTCKNKDYIMRIPGEGTDKLINRREEANVYGVIKEKGISDDIIYINPENGYKITGFLEGARVCDADNIDDLKKCMDKLRSFHEQELYVDHEFELFKQIEFYESLWDGKPSIYKDYEKTKKNVFELKGYIDAHVEKKVLTHIDAVPDNFLFIEDKEEEVRLIDWEYAGMQDPHVDIAMFCIYSLYDRSQVDTLIDLYFNKGCDKETRLKIYCYIAICGLLWSNWCEYKRHLGVEFGEYSIRQYRYAKEYYRIVRDELN